MLLCCCFILHITNSITIIPDEWNDDFLYDIHGMNGWNNDLMTNTTLDQYHGWFGGDSASLPSLYRHFQCSKTSRVIVSFTLYYDCDIEGDEGVKLYFNNNEKLYLRFDDTLNNVFAIYNGSESEMCEQNMDYLIENEIAHALNTFTINFIFSISTGISNEFEGINNIKIKCEQTSNTPTLEPTLNPTFIPTIEPTLISIEPTLEPISLYIQSTQTLYNINAIRNNNDIHLSYLIQWWSSSYNWGFKLFIMVAILCSIIGCVIIICIIGCIHRRKYHSNSAKHNKKNKFGFGAQSLEFSQKQIPTEVVIDRYDSNEDKFVIHKNDMNHMISKRNDNPPPHCPPYTSNCNEVKIHRAAIETTETTETTDAPSNIQIKRNRYRKYNVIPIIQPRLAPTRWNQSSASLASSMTSSSSSIASTSTLTSCATSSLYSDSETIVDSSKSDNSDDTGTSFPTQTATSKSPSTEDEAKVDTHNIRNREKYDNNDNMTTTTTTVDTMCASDVSQTKTQSDYREYQQLSTLNTRKMSKTYKYNYNDDELLMEMDENYHSEEIPHHPQW